MMRLSPAFLVLAACTLAACADDAPAPAAPAVPAASSGPSFTVAVDSLTLDEPERAYRVAIGYPQIRGMSGAPMAAALRAVNAAVADTVAALAAQLRPEAPPPGGEPMTAVTVTGETARSFIADELFSVLITLAADAGSAAPTTFALALTYDLRSGDAVAPADLFADGTPWADTLAAYVARDVARQLAARDGGPLFEPGLDALRAGRVDLTLGPEAAVVRIPPGQLAAGDSAGFDVAVPFRALGPFAQPGGVLARHPAL